MKNKTLLILPIVLLFMGIGQTMADKGENFLRYPALNDAGTKIAFSYQGDIWVKSLTDNTNANRITIHEGYEHSPRWSPNDEYVAFSSNRYGNNDIFAMDAQGGTPIRLTYHSTSDVITDWKSDNELLFTTERAFVQVEREKEIYEVSLDGETPKRVLDAVGLSPVYSPDKRFIALVRGTCRKEREDYKGPANRDIWIYDTKNDEYHQVTTYKGNDFQPQWGGSNTLYFISSRTGKYNIHKVELDENGKKSGDIQAVTNYEEDGVRYFDVNQDASVIAFEKGINIFIKKQNQAEPKKLALTLTKDNRYVPVQHKTYSKNIENYEISPSGKYTAFVIRGELFLINNKKKESRTVRLTNHPYRDFDIDFASDSTIVFVSDRSGQKDIYLLKSADESTNSLYESLELEKIRLTNSPETEKSLNVSPDGQKIAYIRGLGELVVAEIDSDKGKLRKEKILREGWAEADGITWSPDSKWLAYSLEDLYFNAEIYIHAADNSKKPVNVSMHPKGDYAPYWSPDGKKLGFISQRNNGDNDVWFAWLKKEDWQRTQEDWKDFEDEESEEKENGEEKEEIKVEIDLENIHDRLQQVTGLPGNESNVAISEDGKTFYFVSNRDGWKSYKAEQDLYSIQWDGKEMKRLTENDQRPRGIRIDYKTNTLYLLKKGGVLAKLNTKEPRLKPIGIKAEMNIRYQEELEQIFEEAWAILNNNFYDPKFHGNNWNKLKNKYKPMALSASTKHDFRDMFNIMLGQLNASHMGLYGRDMAETENEKTGLLGVEVVPHENGALIKHIIPNSPADKEFSKLHEGEIITNINGEQIGADDNLYAHLINKAEKELYLKVIDEQGNERKVTIRPTNSLRREKYKEWTEERKELTEEYSNGRLGYIHIQAMNWSSFERFERELMASGHGKEGIVIDVRFNGGGWTTDYLMTVLNVRQHAYTIPRGATDNLQKNHKKYTEYYPFSERLPLSAWTKPSIAMCNQNSYSNAEIFSHAYKTLDMGTLVGIPTFGAVISTGGTGMIDNSYLRLPYRAWYVKETRENMENGPAVPDIIIDNRPDSKAENRDEQLKKAVNVLLKQIDEKK